MRYTLRAFLLTAGTWLALIGAYAAIELVRGHTPFAMLEWNKGGKFVALVVLAVLAVGTGVGYASDRIQAQQKTRN